MQRYESYKPSGLDWLGDIPSHWGLKKSKFLWREKEDRSLLGDEELLSVSQYSGVVPRAKESRSESLEDYKRCEPSDLVINIMLAWMSGLGVTKFAGIVSPAYCVYRQLEDHNPSYFDYLYRSPQYLAEFARRSKGIVPSRWRMYTEDFGQILSLLPPREEQDRIVAFLDLKTAEIDAAIAKKELQANLLKEQQFKIINLAVTKGLDPSASMIPGDAAWIDSHPAHWRLMRIKHVLHAIVDTEHKTPPMFDEGPALMVRTSNVKNGELVFKNAKYTDEQTYRRWTRRAIPVPGDILFTREAPAGEACVLPEGIKAAIGQRMVLFKVDPGRLDPHFAVHSIYSGAAKAFIELLSVGSTVAHFNMSDIGNIPLLLPPLQEQQAISKKINSIQDQFRPLINSVETGVERLKELKRTMIASVVLGQVTV